MRLGERFAWRARVQALWDAQDQARAETEAAAVAYEAAVRVYEAATDALDRAEAGEAAPDATGAAQAAAGDAEDAAWAIYRAAQADGDWEAMTTDTQAHMATARSAVKAAAGFAIEALNAQTVTEAAAEAARIAAQASEAARALAEQSGATEGAETYWDTRSEGLSARHDAEYSASVAAAIAGPTDGYVAQAATAVADAAWRAARVFASVDDRGVAAFKESLQQSCR